MGKGKVRLRAGKGKRWRKGQSSSSNPETKKHRIVAKGKLGSHLSQAVGVVNRPGLTLTKEALATHDAIQGDRESLRLDRDGDADFSNVEDGSSGHIESASTGTGVTSLGTSTVYSLIETSHPVFGKVKRLWNSPMESHREICAVLAAVSEVIKSNDGKDTETEYFGALMTSLEGSEDEKSTAAIAYLLSLILPKVPSVVLQSRYSHVCKIIADKLCTYETSDSTALLKGLVTALTALLSAQDGSIWSDGYTQKVFQTLLNYTIHPKPRLRKAAQVGVASMLREGVSSGDFHPSAGLVTRHCKHVVEKGGLETATLHILGMLKDCLANFPTPHVKTLCEMILKLMTLSNSVVRTTGLKVLNGLFLSMVEPQGLTEQLNAQLISALYDYQPSMLDAQLLLAWLTVMQSAHTKLASLNLDLCLGHLPRLFQCCISCMMSSKGTVKQTATDAMQELLKCCVGKCIEELKSSVPAGHKEGSKKRSATKPNKMDPLVGSIQAAFRAVECGLKYKYYSSWDQVLNVLATFYQVAAGSTLCQPFMAKSLPLLCDLRNIGDFPYTSELDAAFGTAVRTMGPRVVLEAVPLQLDEEVGSVSHDFPRSWMLPVMKEYIEHTELAYFTQTMLPMAAQLRTKGIQYIQAGKPLEAKLYATLQFQIWSLLPRFCIDPTDLKISFPMVARILGSALNERVELRPIVCHALTLLIQRNANKEENQSVLSRFSKNYLPILFNLYTDPEGKPDHKSPLMDCVKAYVSISDSKLLESFFVKIMGKLRQEDTTASSKHLVFDLAHCFVPYLSLESLNELFGYLIPLLDSGDGTMQKKAYTCLGYLLSCTGDSHRAFHLKHMMELQQILLDSLSTSSAASKKPRLKCLLHLTNHLTTDCAGFINAVTPEVILCTKEVNEKTRELAFKLLIKLSYTAQRCYDKKADEAVSNYFMTVLAGLAGSTHMISATLLALSRLVYEFHDLLGAELVKRLLSSTCVFLSSKSREVVRATLEFIKVTIGVLPASELVPHVEDMVTSILSWGTNTRSHFRLKARVILERLIRKCGYDVVASFVPEKHKKLILHIRKMNERQKKKKLSKMEASSREEHSHSKRSPRPSYEELLMESSDEEGEPEQSKKKRAKKSLVDSPANTRGKAWIKEGGPDEPINFLDPSVTQRVSATNPAKVKSRKQTTELFKTNTEGKLVIRDEAEGERVGLGGDLEQEVVDDEEMDLDESAQLTRKRKRSASRGEDDDDTLSQTTASGRSHGGGGGKGIHRPNAHKNDFDFDYGAEYRSKRARGDVKRKGKPDPYAYLPLMRQKLNRRKQAKLAGQFSGFMKKAKKGSAVGAKQHRRRH